ncbi:hypothetical protein TKK_0016665 [Trichogramma kaykai]
MTTQASNAQVVLAMATGCEKARPAVVDATAVTECLPDLCKYSNFHRIISVIYHFYRWHFRANKRAADGSKLLDADIWRKARWCCFKMIQAHHFKEEIQAIKNKKPISRRSHLARLAPMFGRDELLRVGGRLQNAQLSYDETHPIILPGECIIVRRLIEYEHREETMHGGAQLMRSQLARQFWITLGERIVQSVCRACIKCTRYRAVPVEQQMAPLPAVRVTPARAFKSIGLDYAGPLPVLFSRAKKASTSKGYVAIFICLITLAVHIEIVSDLTADAFLAAYARFVARKGRPSIIFSDNGTTFKGAARELKELFDESSVLTDRVRPHLTRQGMAWSFIPPRAPHFGGLWEAAVRSFKHHFRQVIGDSRLTFEELSTVAARIEACLNSRPLCPRTNKPDEYAALTPGDLWLGTSVLDYPEPYTEPTPSLNFRSRWRLLRSMRDAFWHRWRKEVLTQMQQRHRWTTPRPCLKPGDMVLMKDDQCPPSTWPLARVESVHPGKDGLVRVATIRTADSRYTRPDAKLIELPRDLEVEDYVRKFCLRKPLSQDSVETSN